MPIDEDAKKQRTTKKRALTILQGNIKRYIAEDNKEKTDELVKKLRDEYQDFEKIQEKYHASCDAGAETEESEDYMLVVEEKYTDCLMNVNTWRKSLVVEVKKESVEKPPEGRSTFEASLLAALNMPKLELKVFDGDPLEYHSFVSTFEELVDGNTTAPGAKLSRLITYTSGIAQETVASYRMLGGVKGYDLARKDLKEKFGDDKVIAQTLVTLLRNWPYVRKAIELQHFANKLVQGESVLEHLRDTCRGSIENDDFIATVADRMPLLKGKWKKYAMKKKGDSGCYPAYRDLVKFVQTEARIAADPVYGDDGVIQFNRRQHQQQQSTSADQKRWAEQRRLSEQNQRRQQSTTFAATTQGTSVCLFCNEAHRIYMCNKFKTLRADQKLSFITEKRLCENCLRDNHTVGECYLDSRCGVNGCSLKHSRFIHSLKVPSTVNHAISGDHSNVSIDNHMSNDVVLEGSDGVVQIENRYVGGSAQVCVPIVRVKVNNQKSYNSMLDTCSTSTFCTRKLADDLSLRGVHVDYELSTLSSSSETKHSEIIPTMFVESVDGHSIMLHNVLIIDHIPGSDSCIDISKFEHLKDIDVMTSSSVIDLLIGQDNAEALIPLEVCKGNVNEPFGVRTALGWSVHGNTGNRADICGLVRSGKISHRVVSNFIETDKLDVSQLDRIEDKVDRLWRLDHDDYAGVDRSVSCEDDQVLKLWDECIEYVDGHYVLPIPWKDDVEIPCNYEVASSRLRSLVRSLERQDKLGVYDAEIQKLLTKGYAEVVPEGQSSSSKIWYLPHHKVETDKKPGKIRVVFDCAAEFKGESLNDKCKQGPDLNNKVVHVLLRFRQYLLAIMADVEAMYYQVRVKVSDRDALRFLWIDSSGKVVEYRMNAHIFGGVWCACIATYAMRKTLEDQKVEDEFVVDVVNRSFYVDDCLRSVSSVEEAKKVVVDVKQVLQEGGFNLTKFVTNDEEVLATIKEEDRAKEIKELGEDVVSKALGISWEVKQDVFKIKIDVKQEEVVTRKIMLKVIASRYDPLGLVSPCVVTGRMLFQEATRLKIGWEEAVPDHIAMRWKKWIEELDELKNVSFPRCMKKEGVRYEVHNFSDASEKGYGCCSYLKSILADGSIHVSLMMSKARVSPMKHVTIPRLELQAALVAAQMNEVVKEELDIPISKTYFWVDSQIVLAYIKNKKKRLKTYVANRVSKIHSISKVDEWKFVPGRINTADYVSRGMSPKEMMSSRWETGPEFLWEEEMDEVIEECEIPAGDEEVKKEVVVNVVRVEEHPISRIVKYYSSWRKVKRVVAWMLKIKKRLMIKKKEVGMNKVTVDDMKQAEEEIIKYVQSQTYTDEIKELKKNEVVKKSSHVSSLMPMMNEKGIVCVGGRLRNMKGDDQWRQPSMHPMLLPPDHDVTKLIVKEYHEIAHQGTEWTLSLVRYKFWITKPRSVIKKVRKDCRVCRRLFNRPVNQKMADLPEARTQVTKPFAHVGIDCFGPFYVQQGRAQVKRWGCVYTCLNMRAVHIEKLDSLDTDSFINAFRRFMARRDTPNKVWSDNGTNFVGGCPELIKCMQELDEDKIARFGLERDVEWNFNPPHASHMGGVWERQIRSIRRILIVLLSKHADKLSSEVLETFFCEVEAIINSRPLTKMSEDVTDAGTLSPCQLLMLNEAMGDFPGEFHSGDKYRKRWKFIQYLANQFWKRWLREYLPELQRRSKWLKEEENIKVGDVVLVCEEATPRFLWPLGLVVEVKKGRDQLVRSVKVKTKSTELVRPVSKVVRLEG